MKRRTKQKPEPMILTLSYAKLQMQNLKDALNADTARVPVGISVEDYEWRTVDVSEMKRELRRLITLWEKSEQNLSELFKQNPMLQDCCTKGSTYLIPSREGKSQLGWLPDLSKYVGTPQGINALRHFVYFLVNPLANKLSGPCPRCNKYFLKEFAHNTKYCKRTCGARDTAETATQKRRQNERTEKLMKVRELICKWEKLNRRGDWKKWVAQDPTITPKWLTRAVNRGDLFPPLGE